MADKRPPFVLLTGPAAPRLSPRACTGPRRARNRRARQLSGTGLLFGLPRALQCACAAGFWSIFLLLTKSFMTARKRGASDWDLGVRGPENCQPRPLGRTTRASSGLARTLDCRSSPPARSDPAWRSSLCLCRSLTAARRKEAPRLADPPGHSRRASGCPGRDAACATGGGAREAPRGRGAADARGGGPHCRPPQRPVGLSARSGRALDHTQGLPTARG